jgi:beta-lactamase regulating signal transducer with metallopeptidase domain
MPFPVEIVSALAATLAHSLWQGAIIAVGLGAVLAALRRRRAGERYLAACTALLLLLLAPLVTFAVLMNEPTVAGTIGPAAQTPVIGDAGPETMEVPAGMPTTAVAGRLSVRPIVVGLWLLGVTAVGLWHLGGWWRVRRCTVLQIHPAPAAWSRRFGALAQRLDLTRRIRLLVSDTVTVPMVIGWLRPVVLVPASLIGGMPVQHLEWILMHELAHVRRHDYLVNLLQVGVETLMFYHPAVWWLGAVIRRERELCCDDIVTTVGGDPHGYARALLSLAEQNAAASGLAPAANGGSLLARIQRLIEGDAMNHSHTVRPRLGGLVLVALLLAAGAMLAMAAEGRAPAAEGTGSGTNRKAATVATVASASAGAVSRAGDDAIVGDWRLRRGDQPRVRLDVDWEDGGEARMTMELSADEAARLRESDGPVEIAREAGRFVFERDGSRGGEFAFSIDDGFRDHLEDRGIEVDDRGEIFVMAASGMTHAWVDALTDRTRGNIDAGDVVAAGIHRVTPEFLDEMADLGFADEMFDSYVAMRIHGVNRAELTALREAGMVPDGADEAIAWRIHGVDPELVAAVRSSGYDLDGDEILAWTIHGIDPDYVREMKATGLEIHDGDHLTAMKIHRVTPEFVREMSELGLEDLDVEQLLEMRIHGVTPEWVRALRDKGIDLSADELVRLKISGVDI